MQLDVTSKLSALSEQLNKAYDALDGDREPLLEAIAGIVEGSTQERFITKTAPDGSAWADLLPATVDAKNGRGGVLVDHGDLMKSITGHATPNTVEVGSDRDYAKYHQDGTKNADGSERMPQRQIFGLSEDDYSDIGELINDFLEDIYD